MYTLLRLSETFVADSDQTRWKPIKNLFA